MNTTTDRYLTRRGVKNLKKQITKTDKELTKLENSLKTTEASKDSRFVIDNILSHIEQLKAEKREIKQVLANSKVLPRKRDRLYVALGSIVDLIDAKGRLMTLMIVDSIEANPSNGKISANSPLGESLIGKTIQETISLTIGSRKTELQLVAIR